MKNLDGGRVIIVNGQKMIKLVDDTEMTMEEYWNESQLQGGVLYAMSYKEQEYFDTLTEPEKADYIKKHG